MKMRTAMPSKQGGFSLLTGFILAIVMFGSLAFFLAGQGVNSSFGSSYSNSSKASALLTSAGYIKTGFDSVIFNGAPASSITFNDASNTGIFNPATGGATPQPLDPSIFVSDASHKNWIYRAALIKLEDVGGVDDTDGDYTVIAVDIKLSICQQINNILYGDTTIPTFDTTGTEAQLIGTAPGTLTTYFNTHTGAVDLSSDAQLINGKMNGCFSVPDGSAYVYIHTLLAQ